MNPAIALLSAVAALTVPSFAGEPAPIAAEDIPKLRAQWLDYLGGLPDVKAPLNARWLDDGEDFPGYTRRKVAYAIEPGVHHQGKLVLNEALADQAGVHLAYLALKKSMATHPVPTVDGFTPEQQFFLALAQIRGDASFVL